MIYGLDVAVETFRSLDPSIALEPMVAEGEWRDGGPVLRIDGSARAILTAERTALNFLQRLSGVATMAARYVEAVSGTGATILDTRKTTPGLRALEKAAVAAGGATNHRFGLFDAILIKENHAAAAGGVGEAVRKAHALRPGPSARGRVPGRWPRSTRRSRPAPASRDSGSCSTTCRPSRCAKPSSAWPAGPSSRPAAG